jgi:hypothetical protein
LVRKNSTEIKKNQVFNEPEIHRLFLATKVHKGTQEKKSIQTFPMKNFWESRTLFIKRVLAAGGKSAGEFSYLCLAFLLILK